MFSALRKYLLIPRLIRLSSAAPKDPRTAWDQFWGNIRSTGATGDVLWDSGSDHELNGYLPKLAHLDPALPVVDVGCGNGSFTRLLAQHFPHALGLDYSANAVDRARQEAADITTASFAVCDMTAPDAAQTVATALQESGWTGDANVFIRGVLHVLDRDGRSALAANLLPVVGTRGSVFLAETNFPGTPVDYVSHLGATRKSIPGPLEWAIRGLPMPGRFGAKQRAKAFPTADWNLVEEGSASIETRPLSNPSAPDVIPGYYALLRARQPS
ncbi:Methyltransferase domain-containing protein [Arthrobacter sp. yr096]|uniref:class I SAM-dependent methyltransferase n=1 Tax=unclassified Arthrobacter TaxID=235627 RepID=UPI0008983A9B|nr:MULTISPECIES: class I SAM-dependent methyltransferase [unclassified Arthrobacter]SDX17019.1 Methyltransferase domain-containing protein [Arthrobacter sp. cf158]SEI41441.1 Methyltransferase domain-containing protein [Arthrobacter sp. yr096]